jgi:hypothetical protein
MNCGIYVAKAKGNLWWYQDRSLTFFEKMENMKNEE